MKQEKDKLILNGIKILKQYILLKKKEKLKNYIVEKNLFLHGKL